jgi:CheY-like chemotaxis protein
MLACLRQATQSLPNSDLRDDHVKVLIVADESLSQMHLADDVELSGHAVLESVPSTGAGLLLARSEKPHAAIIDLDLRFTADGLDLARALHSMAVPCVVATGDAHMANAAAHVATAIVRKPL